MAKRLLIAGYGFLGAALREVFADAGWQVDCLSRSGSHGVACDLSDAGQVAAIPGVYDAVIHCAASGGGSERDYRKVYLNGCENLVARFGGAGLVFTSSSSVYPQTDHSVVTEDSPAEPTSPRAMILRQAENVVLAAGGTVARLSGLYGPGRCHVLRNFLQGRARLDGDGQRVMNFVHRDDVARALLLLAERDAPVSGIFNVNGGYATQREVYQGLADHFGLPLPPVAEGVVPRKRGNTSKKISSARLEAMGWRAGLGDFLSLALACSEVP